MKRIETILTSVFMLLAFTVTTAHSGAMDDPFGHFNVYIVGGGIIYNNSDFEGKAAAGGDVKLVDFNLAVKDQGGYSMHVGGNVELVRGVYNGAIEAAGNISISNVTIYGDVKSGGSVGPITAQGSVYGDVSAAGTVDLPASMIKGGGQAYNDVPYDASIDLDAISNYFTSYSAEQGALADTGSIGNTYGTLSLTAQSGLNVFSIDAAQLNNAHTFNITGGADSVVVINVSTSGGTASLNYTGWNYSGGISPGDVLLNYPDATNITFTSSNYVNILAPSATATFNGGRITGNFIVGSLSGTGQVNIGHFSHGGSVPTTPPGGGGGGGGGGPGGGSGNEVPEPMSIVLFGTGLIGLTGMRQRMKKS